MSERAAPPPLDELLARREWVRRFARTLARDDASADDLAQEAWLAAVEHPPAHADAPAGWFRRVLLRRAMNRTRGERRRGIRENAAARRDAAPATADVVAAAESHRRVVEAVMSLDEPYRTTVLLRFFEDLPPHEVAARMDVPVETVRARVRRAVEKLRARLDDEHGGRRAAWLVPLLATGRGRAVPTTAAPAAKGAIAMTTAKKAAIVAALLVLCAGATAIVLRTRPDDAGTVAGTSASARDIGTDSTARRTRSRADDAGGSESARQTAVAAPPEAGRVDGSPAVARDFDVVVVDPTGHCVEGVRVGVHVKGAQPRRDTGSDFPITRSDADGRAAFRVAGDVEAAWAESTDRSEYVFNGEKVPVAPGASQVRIVVERRTWIGGVVVGEDGMRRPRSDLVVLDRGRQVARVLTDDDGRFRVGVRPGGLWDVALTGLTDRPPAAGVPEFVGESPGVASGTESVTVVARPASGKVALHVRAETSDGRPLAGVNVAVTSPSYRKPRGVGAIDARREEQFAALDTYDAWTGTATTGTDGRCEFADIPDRRVCVNVATRYGEVPAWESAGWIKPWQVFARPGRDELVLVFRRGRAMRGRVEIPDGAPVPSAPGGGRWRAMIIVQAQEDGAIVSATWCDENGRFTAWAPADEPGPFRVSAGGWLTPDNRLFQAQTETVPAGAEDVVLRIVEKKD